MRENLGTLAESGFDVEFLVQLSTPLFVSLTEPAARPAEHAVFRLGRLRVTTRPAPRTFDARLLVVGRDGIAYELLSNIQV